MGATEVHVNRGALVTRKGGIYIQDNDQSLAQAFEYLMYVFSFWFQHARPH